MGEIHVMASVQLGSHNNCFCRFGCVLITIGLGNFVYQKFWLNLITSLSLWKGWCCESEERILFKMLLMMTKSKHFCHEYFEFEICFRLTNFFLFGTSKYVCVCQGIIFEYKSIYAFFAVCLTYVIKAEPNLRQHCQRLHALSIESMHCATREDKQTH